ncbi:MAG TPA: hypothetical protein VFV87_07240 [Pirellulaceae bacterium]|nr:hypothetical protein [Pirellulaceae bacterium]
MAIWFLRLSATLCFTTAAGALSLIGLDWYRHSADEAEYGVARQHVSSLGGRIFKDDYGNYIIELQRSSVTDAELERLVLALQPLRSEHSSPDIERMFAFDLSATSVGDRGVQAIADLPLDWLNLNSTQITDGAFPHLYDQERLAVMTVSETHVTWPAIQEMRAHSPHVWIPATLHGIGAQP